jgi:hypothetical protein
VQHSGAHDQHDQISEGGRTMTTTPLASSTFGRACTETVAAPAHASAAAHAAIPVRAMSSAAVATPTTDVVAATNPWLGGDVQGSGFGSKYATKRIAPGRLEGMT